MTAAATLTAEQTAAISMRETSVALGAGAGCGKTFVLTERFLADLAPSGGQRKPARLHELVAITFTDAAAREMRDRIRQRCYERLQAEGAYEQGWLQLLREIDSARISTIHSFCGNLLRSYAVEANVDPSFEVLPQGDAEILLLETIDDVLRSELVGQHEPILDLITACGLSAVKEQIRSLLNDWRAPLAEQFASAQPEFLLERWQHHYHQHTLPTVSASLASSPSVATILNVLTQIEASSQGFISKRQTLLQLLPQLSARASSYAQLQQIQANCYLRGLARSKCWPNQDVYEAYKEASAAVVDAIKKLPPPPDGAESLEIARYGLEAFRLAQRVAVRYGEKKADQGKLDFQDLLAKAHQLLVGAENQHVRDELAANLRLVLVDEFQDTDGLQVELITALCGGNLQSGKLFFVGDHKQSIYRFRGAEPIVFHQLQRDVREAGRLALTLNFRSQPGILRFVNHLFGEELRDYQALRPHRGAGGRGPAVEFLWTEVEKSLRADECRLREARHIARRLRAMLDAREPIVGDQSSHEAHPRPLQAGDIAILFRALSDVRYYEQALREFGLNYYLVGGHAFYAQQEIFDVLNLLRSVATSCDEIALAGALRSPFFSLADETLFWMVDRAGSLNKAIRDGIVPAELSRQERIKLQSARTTLMELRNSKDQMSIASLIATALDRTGYDATILAEFLGERKLANLHKLLEQARSTDQSGLLDLQGFITQLSEFVSRQPKEAPAATCPQAADVIRLMTIHQAKGLEFPLVVVPDLERSSTWTAPAAKLHAELGPLIKNPNRQRATAGMELFRLLDEPEEREERKRIFYVACTRAADHLLLSSSVSNLDAPASDWMKMLSRRFDLRSGESRGGAAGESLVTVVHDEMLSRSKPQIGPRGPDLQQAVKKAKLAARSRRGITPRELSAIPVNSMAPRQFSVSSLTGHLLPHPDLHADELEVGPAEQIGESQVDPRQLGILVHDVLERLRLNDENRVDHWCHELALVAAPDDPQPLAVEAAEMVHRFLRSARARQLATSTDVRRELEFLLAWPPPGEVVIESVLCGHWLQGYIDCLYRDPAGVWCLVDFKSGRPTAGDLADAALRYELQLGVYALAVEEGLGETPTQLVIHFLRTGDESVMRWDHAMRRQTISRVNQSIESLVGN